MSFDEIDRQQRAWDERARVAQGAAAHAYARLLDLAERRDSGQDQCIAQFLASTSNGEASPESAFGWASLRFWMSAARNLLH